MPNEPLPSLSMVCKPLPLNVIKLFFLPPIWLLEQMDPSEVNGDLRKKNKPKCIPCHLQPYRFYLESLYDLFN